MRLTRAEMFVDDWHMESFEGRSMMIDAYKYSVPIAFPKECGAATRGS